MSQIVHSLFICNSNQIEHPVFLLAKSGSLKSSPSALDPMLSDPLSCATGCWEAVGSYLVGILS